MTSRNERIDLLGDELLAAALAATGDLALARTRATIALDRILERDPGLTRLAWILSALHQAREANGAGRVGAMWSEPAYAHA